MIVVDASALLEVLLGTRSAEGLIGRLFDPGETLHAPHLIDLEVAQVLRRYAQAGEVPLARCRAALSDFADLPLTRYPHDVLLERVWALRDNLTAYDAAYVALAEALDAPLVTTDRGMAFASGHRARIELV